MVVAGAPDRRQAPGAAGEEMLGESPNESRSRSHGGDGGHHEHELVAVDSGASGSSLWN